MIDEERRLQAVQEYNKQPGGNWITVINAADTEFQLPYLRPQSPEAPGGDVEMLGTYPFAARDTNNLTIAFSSLNGYWNERLHLRRIDGKWHQALSVMGPTSKQALHPFVYSDSDYPEGKALAEKDWLPAKPVKPLARPVSSLAHSICYAKFSSIKRGLRWTWLSDAKQLGTSCVLVD